MYSTHTQHFHYSIKYKKNLIIAHKQQC